MNINKILVTGATGFVGQALIKNLVTQDYSVRAAVRCSSSTLSYSVKQCVVGDLAASIDWSETLQAVDIVVHCAGRAHIMSDAIADPLSAFRQVNTEATLALARQAAEAGVRRFVFLSSIGVNGRTTKAPFKEDDIPAPEQDYAISKLEAEKGLQDIALSSGMEVVIIRPPLVYGANAPGNFGKLMNWMDKNIPLPFGAINNKRSFVALDNLIDFIITCIKHPAAANEVFLVSDGEDLSTTELLNRVAGALGKKSRLLPVNQTLLAFCLKLIGKKDLAQRLCGSLQVDISKAKKLLNWTPPVNVDEGLRKTAEGFKNDLDNSKT